MAAKSTTTTSSNVSSVPTRDEFIAEYMKQLGDNRAPKKSIIDRLAGYAEDRVVAGVKNSRHTVGRINAAWEISGDISHQAYLEEHAKHAADMAAKFGCV